LTMAGPDTQRDPRTKGTDQVSTPGGSLSSGRLADRQGQLDLVGEASETVLREMLQRFRFTQSLTYDTDTKKVIRSQLPPEQAESMVLLDIQGRASDPVYDSRRARKFDNQKREELESQAREIANISQQLRLSDPGLDATMERLLKEQTDLMAQMNRVELAGKKADLAIGKMQKAGVMFPPGFRESVLVPFFAELPSDLDYLKADSAIDNALRTSEAGYSDEEIAAHPRRSKILNFRRQREKEERAGGARSAGSKKSDRQEFEEEKNLRARWTQILGAETDMLQHPDFIAKQGEFDVTVDDIKLPADRELVALAIANGLHRMAKIIEGQGSNVDAMMSKLGLEEEWAEAQSLDWSVEAQDIRRDEIQGIVRQRMKDRAAAANAEAQEIRAKK